MITQEIFIFIHFTIKDSVDDFTYIRKRINKRENYIFTKVSLSYIKNDKNNIN